jgi:hypothetical protein
MTSLITKYVRPIWHEYVTCGKTRMIRNSDTGYNYCSRLPVTPRCVGQTISDFLHVGCDVKTQFLLKVHICVSEKKFIKRSVHVPGFLMPSTECQNQMTVSLTHLYVPTITFYFFNSICTHIYIYIYMRIYIYMIYFIFNYNWVATRWQFFLFLQFYRYSYIYAYIYIYMM